MFSSLISAQRDWFVSHGVGIFPLRDRSKEPACKWKEYAAPVRSTNYGVRLGRCAAGVLLVVDTDEAATEAWIQKAEATGALPRTPFRVSTGRGTHRYFQVLDVPSVKFIHPAGLTIEVKGQGQYVVGPGSIHPTGAIYVAADWSWRWVDLPILPNEILIDERTAQPSHSDGHYEFPDIVSAGERHDALFRLVRSQKGLGCSTREEVRDLVTLANQHRCHPPLTENSEFERWFERAWTLPDRPLDPLGTRTPIDVDLTRDGWL